MQYFPLITTIKSNGTAVAMWSQIITRLYVITYNCVFCFFLFNPFGTYNYVEDISLPRYVTCTPSFIICPWQYSCYCPYYYSLLFFIPNLFLGYTHLIYMSSSQLAPFPFLSNTLGYISLSFQTTNPYALYLNVLSSKGQISQVSKVVI